MPLKRITALGPFEELLSNIDTSGRCWHWRGVVGHGGYGLFSSTQAHRVVYEAILGEIPQGLQLDHLCRTRDCVRPSHLEPVTPRINVRRSESPAAFNAVKTHCLRGHAFDEINTYLFPDGRRCCRACKTVANRRSELKRKDRRAKDRVLVNS